MVVMVEVCGAADGAFASRLAPTGATHFKFGSEPAREEAGTFSIEID
jgi:hypothetical protein